MIIVLLGYMASGKTHVGNVLANVLNYEFIDLDAFIEQKSNMDISSIFNSNGELFFRKLEHQCLKELIETKSDLVLALGGGTPCYSFNMDLINRSKKTLSFYLETALPVLVERLMKEKNSRPLVSHIKNKNEMQEFVGKHLFERTQFYTMANFSIKTSYKDAKQIVEEILFLLY